MTFADAFLFAYVVFATVAFTCSCVYFAIRGAQEHLKQAKLGRDIQHENQEYRELVRAGK